LLQTSIHLHYYHLNHHQHHHAFRKLSLWQRVHFLQRRTSYQGKKKRRPFGKKRKKKRTKQKETLHNTNKNGKITIKQALCHCTDCQKISGSAYSVNNVVSGQDFKVTGGSPKVYTKTADSGKKISSYFCGDCGSTLYRDGENFPGMKIVKVGVLGGETLEESRPNVELFAPTRPGWISKLEGAEQKNAM
jgi:hypothetical protein